MIETEGCVTRLYCAKIQTRMKPHKGQGAVDRPANGGGYNSDDHLPDPIRRILKVKLGLTTGS